MHLTQLHSAKKVALGVKVVETAEFGPGLASSATKRLFVRFFAYIHSQNPGNFFYIFECFYQVFLFHLDRR
jgi:hypothetical protein